VLDGWPQNDLRLAVSVMHMETTKVGIVGLGTVGSGVARLLLEHADRTARHAGRRIVLEHVVVRDPDRPRRVDLPPGIVSGDLRRITENPEITVVAHLVGGLEPARTIMLQLLDSGKDVVTANKALLAEHGPELFDRARALGRSIAFEAAVAGGIPIIANISQCLSANEILSLDGILNGTSNFILTRMEEQGADYQAALAEARQRGYAEADPTMDVDGSDATQKLAILAHLAFGVRVPWREIPRSGIDRLDLADVRYARELGYRIKLLAVARREGKMLELHVSPTLVRIGTPMAEVRKAFNAVNVVGHAVGSLFFHGLGAGQMPTASAVVADLIDTMVGRAAITFRTLELWSDSDAPLKMLDPARCQGRFYLRFNVEDRPGVLAEITGILGRKEISIASVIQHDSELSGSAVVPLVIMTHRASEGALREAIEAIDHQSSVRPPSVWMRVYE
jgi:homoserine dehydrogenase